MSRVASILGDGKYTTPDVARGRQWHERSIQRALATRDCNGLYWIAEGYLRDTTRTALYAKDERRAVDIFNRSAEMGCDDGVLWMGRMFESGTGVQRDLAKAIAYYRRLADNGKHYGTNGLPAAMGAGRSYEKLGQHEEAAKYFRMFADLADIGDGRTVPDFFAARGISACGPTAEGKTRSTNCGTPSRPR
jgi:tetratricopeptide (TPR) repeat protein